MKTYKDLNNNLWAYEEDGSQDNIIPSDYILITEAEAEVIRISQIPIPTAADNKATAQGILSSTDWTTIADVASPTNSPYLTNQAAFIAYRNTIRGIAVNPTAGNLTWPTQPTDTWSTV